jgi:hypothetical protein
MSEDKKNSEDVNATLILPVQDVDATVIVPPQQLRSSEHIDATVFITPQSDKPDVSQELSSINLNKSDEVLVADNVTKVIPVVDESVDISCSKTGEMEIVPATQASAFDVLLGRTGVVTARQFGLKKNKLTIGRSPFNDIIIKSDSVSASHAELIRAKGRWVLRDIGSSNGLSVNGVSGSKGDEFDLAISDQILIGDVILQLCSPHTIDEMLATPLQAESLGVNKAIVVKVAAVVITIVIIAVVVLLS